jgi:hypothetical protein
MEDQKFHGPQIKRALIDGSLKILVQRSSRSENLGNQTCPYNFGVLEATMIKKKIKFSS